MLSAGIARKGMDWILKENQRKQKGEEERGSPDQRIKGLRRKEGIISRKKREV